MTKINHERRESDLVNGVCRVVGTMSGTSCDGLDVVMIEVSTFHEEVRWLAIREFAYPNSWVDRLRNLGSTEKADAHQLEQQWTRWVADKLAPLVQEWAEEFGPVHLLGFSGHTWYHEPRGRGTRAIGDGEVLFQRLGIPVVADYRSADVAAGGEGAPLVPLFDAEVFSDQGACLNLGGIANLTLLPRLQGEVVQASDLCGANLLLNRQALRAGQPFDVDGDGARTGRVVESALVELDRWPYLNRPWPKSLAAEDLWFLNAVLDDIVNPWDAAATVVEWIASTVGRSLPERGDAECALLITGGGAHHGLLIERLQAYLPEGWRARLPDRHWIDGKEAAAFAWLALRTAQGKSTSLASVTGARRDVCGGVLFGTFAAPEGPKRRSQP